jgi:hypothetical protein
LSPITAPIKQRSYARKAGAVVYERFDLTYKGKGYALDYLTEHISHDYGRDYFDAFFVFDADNLLDANYISERTRLFRRVSDCHEL